MRAGCDRAEVRDCVRDHGQDAAPAGQSAGVGADRVHVAQYGVEALVGDMPAPIDVVGEPGKPPGEGGREHVDLGRCVDECARRGRQLAHLGDCGVGDEQEPLGRSGPAHGWLPASGWSPAPDGGSVTVHVSC